MATMLTSRPFHFTVDPSRGRPSRPARRSIGLSRRNDHGSAKLWPEVIVSDNTLNVHVSRLRAALGDTKRPHRLLKSVSRAGFMVVATPTPKRVAPVHGLRVSGDKSRFVRDVTIPDGSVFEPGEAFEKIWEIQNLGSRGSGKAGPSGEWVRLGVRAV